MKRIIITIASALFILSGINFGQAHAHENHCETAITTIGIDQEVLPVKELPTIDIEPIIGRNSNIHTATIDDELAPLIILDEIIITPNS